MSSRSEMILALAAASGLHGLALVSIDLPAGGVASGSGGQASISIAATTPELRAVVEAWETPPNVAEDVQPASAPETGTLPKPPGAWGDVRVTDMTPNSLKVPEFFAAPTTTPAAAPLSKAPKSETRGNLDSTATDVALRQNKPRRKPCQKMARGRQRTAK